MMKSVVLRTLQQNCSVDVVVAAVYPQGPHSDPLSRQAPATQADKQGDKHALDQLPPPPARHTIVLKTINGIPVGVCYSSTAVLHAAVCNRSSCATGKETKKHNIVS